jgi:Flp pilus assembly pilin Flp
LSSLLGDIEGVFGAVATAFQKIGSTISNIPSSITNFFGQLGAAIYGAFTAFGTLLRDAWNNFVNVFYSIGQWFYNAFVDIANFFRNLWDSIVRFFTWLGREIWNALVRFFSWVVNAFEAIAHYIVQHLNQAFGSLDAALYGLWCNFRNKLNDIIVANVTEVLVYKSIESAAEGRIPLRGLRDWISLGIRVLGAPVIGSVAASVLGSVLPACGPRRRGFVGQLVVPTISVSGAAAATVTAAPPTVTTGVGFQRFTPSLTVSYGFTYTVGRLPSVSESYTVKYLVTVQTNAVTMYLPFRVSVTVGLSSYASMIIQHPTPVSGAVSLGTSLSYTTYLGVPAFGSASLGASLTYSLIASGSVASVELLNVSVTYSVAASQSASGSVNLGVSLSYMIYFGVPVQGSTSLGVSVSYSAYGPISSTSTLTQDVSVTYTVGGYASASGAVSLSATVSYSTAAPSSASGSTSLGVSVSYSAAAPVSSSNTLTQNVSVSYTVSGYASTSGSTSLGVSITYSVLTIISTSGSSTLGVTVSYSTAAPSSSSGLSELSTSLTYSIANPPPAQATSASVAVGVSGQAADPATFALTAPTPVAVAYLYSIGPTPAAQALMSIVARGSPSPALDLIKGLINTYGVNYVQSVLYAAADLYYFSPMIVLFTFNQSPVSTSGGVYYGFNPPLFASSITGDLQSLNCVRCTPVVVANTVAISHYIAGAFNYGGTGGFPGCNDGGPGAQGIVLITNSIITPATLTANGYANISPCSGTLSGSATGSPYLFDAYSPYVPLNVYLNYAGGYWWLSPYTPPRAGGGTCCGTGCSFIGAGGGGAGSYNCANGYGGWFFSISPGTCYVSPGNNYLVATPYLMFTDPQSMAVALMRAVSDLWLMYVLGVTPSSIAPMPVVGGGAGGGGADQAGGGGAGSAGEVIVLAYNYQPLTINANGASALCGSASVGGGGGAGGYVIVMYPAGAAVPSVTASVNGGSPCTANAQGCAIAGSAGSPGVSLVVSVTWSTPPYITPVTVSFR